MDVKRMTMISAMALAIWAPAAAADVVFTTGNHPQDDETNILFAAGETGTLITGEVDHSGVGVQFSSLTGQTLVQSAEGQASITEVNGDPLTSMFVQVPGYTFGDFILNLEN